MFVFFVSVLWSVAATVVFIMMATDEADATAVWGTLKFLMISASGLDRGDGPYEYSEAYVRFRAYHTTDYSVVKTTSETTAKSDSATWNEEIDFGYSEWEKITMQVWDSDTSWWRRPDDRMSSAVSIYFNNYWKCRDEDQVVTAGNARLTFRYCIE